MIEFNASETDTLLIMNISRRACQIVPSDKLQLEMDIEAVHCNDMALDLPKLLAFSDFDFVHDVFGINQHIDRTTGKLQDCFVPRCARQEATN